MEGQTEGQTELAEDMRLQRQTWKQNNRCLSAA